jgi:hypothetical protein
VLSCLSFLRRSLCALYWCFKGFGLDIDMSYSRKSGSNRTFDAIDRVGDFAGGQRTSKLNV